MANQLFAGFVYNNAGVAIQNATVDLYDRNTTTPSRANTTTDANGYWAISHATEGRFDVQIVSGSTTRRRKYDDSIQLETLEVAVFRLRNPADTFDYDIVPAAIVADRQLNLPLLAATDTIAVLAMAQTFLTGVKTFNSSILAIRNPADTFSYTIVASAITAARNLTIPLTTVDDTFVVLALAQTLESKTLTTPTIAATGWTNATHTHAAANSGGTVVAASDTVVGALEIATIAETNTGTDATRAVSPDGLAGSVMGEVVVQMVIVDFTVDVATGDGKFYLHIDNKLAGMDLVRVHAEVITAGTTGTMDIQIANVDAAVDMLSTKLTIDSAETGSDTAATAAVISAANDDVQLNEVLRVDVDAVQTTKAKGLIVTLVFRLP